jgi:hypothetical protein
MSAQNRPPIKLGVELAQGPSDVVEPARDARPDVDSIARDLGSSLALRSLLAYALADLWREQPAKFAAANTVLVQELGESLANLPAPDPLVRDLYSKAEAHASAFLDQVLLMAKHLSAARRESDDQP